MIGHYTTGLHLPVGPSGTIGLLFVAAHTEYAHGVPQSATPADGAWRSETSVRNISQRVR